MRRRPPLCLALASTLPGLALSGCSETLGIEHLPGAPFDYVAPACSECVWVECRDAEAACAADESCAGLHGCLAACTPDDLSCRGSCEASHEVGVTNPAAVRLDECRRARCVEPCLGIGGLWRPVVDAGCGECLDQKCIEANVACLQDRECERVIRCGQQCTEPDCLLECVDRFGTELSPATNQMTACTGGCAALCPYGKTWDCVGGYSWSLPEEPFAEVPIAFQVLDLRLEPAVGLTVTAYANPAPPFEFADSAPTDLLGIAHLNVSVGPLGYDGAFAVAGTIDQSAIYPNRFFFGRPIVHATGTSTLVATYDDIDRYAELLGQLEPPVTLDQSLGQVQASVLDCTMNLAPGIRFEVDAAATTANTVDFYLNGDSTDRTGAGVIANVEPGVVTVSAVRVDTGQVVAHRSIWVGAGEGSILALWPDPS